MNLKKAIMEIVKTSSAPLTLLQIAKKLKIERNQTGMLRTVTAELVKNGDLSYDRGKYSPQKADILQGTVCSTITGSDFFVSDSCKEDLKIMHSPSFFAMHKDTVLVQKKGRSCQIVKILKRANTQIIGTLFHEGSRYYVVPDEKKLHIEITIPKADRLKAQIGDKVVVSILCYPTKKAAAVGRIIEVLGCAQDDETAILSILRTYNIAEDFSKEVLQSAERIPQQISDSDLSGRLDLRGLNVITIDGDDAKDLDDAISLEKTENGHYLLGVHIADVSHYVKPDSVIDKAAAERATSVYIPGTVFPMLPKSLSNGICSLNPQEDRLTLSCFMILSKNGKVLEYTISPSVINSKYRMTYHNVTELLEQKTSPLRKTYAGILSMLLLMQKLAAVLKRARRQRGSIDFNFPEPKFELDKSGFPVSLEKYPIGISNEMIEEFMLKANETVADYMLKNGLPCLYRVHAAPEEKKLTVFQDLIKIFGYRLSQDPSPSDFSKLLKQIEGSKEETLIQKMMLRTMSKAKYKPVCEGHFGLAAEKYLHFTSPIRRYPDLLVHRVLHWSFSRNQKAIEKYSSRMNTFAEICTQQEINAAMCERDIDDIRKAQYMSGHIGEVWEGTISGVTSYGLFAELENTAEGFIPVASMKEDRFEFYENSFCLSGIFTDKKYTLGDKIKIRVHSVCIPEGTIQFELITT